MQKYINIIEIVTIYNSSISEKNFQYLKFHMDMKIKNMIVSTQKKIIKNSAEQHSSISLTSLVCSV